MSHTPLLIHNARMIGMPDEHRGSVLVIDGRIDAVDPVEAPSTAAWVDAVGQLLAPAIIDLGVFAVDPAAFHFGGIARAGLMPDGPPVLDNASLVERAAKAGKPDLWLHPLAAATRGLEGRELAEIGLMQRAGARAIATGRERIADSGVMARLLSYAAGLGLTTIVHAEDEGLRRGAVATEGEMAFRLGLPAAPASVEAIAIARDIALAADTGAAIHFRQVTTAAGFDLIRAAKGRGLKVTCGITPAHLLLSDIAIGEWRSFCRLSPPLRSEDDRQAALAALADGTIDVLCSGHDPRGPEDKRLPFADAAPGMAGAQTLLALGLGLVRDGVITLPGLFQILSANPAQILGVEAGTLNLGAQADLILIDPDAPWQVDTRLLPGRAGNTPFDGLPVQGRVKALWKGGRRVV
jgi:dihydroorotase